MKNKIIAEPLNNQELIEDKDTPNKLKQTSSLPKYKNYNIFEALEIR